MKPILKWHIVHTQLQCLQMIVLLPEHTLLILSRNIVWYYANIVPQHDERGQRDRKPECQGEIPGLYRRALVHKRLANCAESLSYLWRQNLSTTLVHHLSDEQIVMCVRQQPRSSQLLNICPTMTFPLYHPLPRLRLNFTPNLWQYSISLFSNDMSKLWMKGMREIPLLPLSSSGARRRCRLALHYTRMKFY